MGAKSPLLRQSYVHLRFSGYKPSIKVYKIKSPESQTQANQPDLPNCFISRLHISSIVVLPASGFVLATEGHLFVVDTSPMRRVQPHTGRHKPDAGILNFGQHQFCFLRFQGSRTIYIYTYVYIYIYIYI